MVQLRFLGACQPDYARFAAAEARGLDPAAGSVQVLAAGVLAFSAAPDFPRRAQVAPPVFLRHIHPVAAAVALAGEAAADLAALAAAAVGLVAPAGLPAGARVAVQVRRVEAVTALGRPEVRAALEPLLAQAGWLPVTRDPQQVLSVTLVRQLGYLGLSTPADNLSPWPGGEVHYQREGAVSRAGHKLEEALAVFAIPLPPGGRALDLGAAPGGWTQVLLRHGLQVTAVDTAAPDPALLGHPGLAWLPRNARSVTVAPASLDLLTCDMNWQPLPTARLVAALAARGLRPGGHGILTVKLTHGHPLRTCREVRETLARAGLAVHGIKQLYHNRDEVTVWFGR